MHRCWLETETLPSVGGQATLSPDESAHIARVLRMHAGEAVQLIAADRLYACELADVNEKATTLHVLNELPSPECPVHITLAQGLPKLDKLELIVQKATELGVWDVLPVEMERSVAKLDGKEEKKRERISRIALEAAKQSGRAHVPVILPMCGLGEALRYLQAQSYDGILVAWEEENGFRLSEAVRLLTVAEEMPKSVALVIGPEGGLSAQEIERWKAIGARCVTLGKRILRTETAGLCALAVTMSALGEL